MSQSRSDNVSLTSTPARSRSEVLCQTAALAVVAFAFGTSVYRAASQAITHDEARTFLDFVDVPFSRMWTVYDAGNHVLYTVLARWSVRLFGLSEFTLRLPSVSAGLAYLAAAFLLARRLAGRGWVMLAAVAVLALNPFTLDYLSAARGYGLALALYAWGFWILVRFVTEEYDPPARLLPWAGLLFGLSIAANLTFAFAVAGAAIAFAAVARRLALDELWGPGIVPAFVLLALPLARAGRASFYYGARSLHEMADAFVAVSLYHAAPHWAAPGVTEAAVRNVGTYVLAALFALALAGGADAWRKGARGVSLVAAALGGTGIVLLAAHAIAGVPYPLGRTGVALAFLFVLACAAAAAVFGKTRARWAVCAPLSVLLSFALWRFAASYNTSYYNEWRSDAASRRVAAVLRDHARGRKVRVAATWTAVPALRFYRRCWRLDWLPVEIAEPSEHVCDYYVLQDDDRALVTKLGLRTLVDDPVSGTVLAVRP